MRMISVDNIKINIVFSYNSDKKEVEVYSLEPYFKLSSTELLGKFEVEEKWLDKEYNSYFVTKVFRKMFEGNIFYKEEVVEFIKQHLEEIIENVKKISKILFVSVDKYDDERKKIYIGRVYKGVVKYENIVVNNEDVNLILELIKENKCNNEENIISWFQDCLSKGRNEEK